MTLRVGAAFAREAESVAKILIVDAEETAVQLVGRRLTAAGHACKGVSNGKQALAVLAENAVDLVILDVMLPRVSGFEVCRRIRSNPERYSTPVVFVSAMDSPEEISHGLAQGADDYLTKPVDLEDLQKRVEGLLSTNVLTDDQTTLPGAKGTKLEVQKAINARQPFSLVYIELNGMNRLPVLRQAGAREKVLRRFARRLAISGEELTSDVFRVGHMGGGHFVCITEPEQAEAFCLKVRKRWANHVPELMESLGGPGAPEKHEGEWVETLVPSCFITTTHGQADITFRSLFDTLSHLRQNGHAGSGGVFIDRRSAAAI